MTNVATLEGRFGETGGLMARSGKALDDYRLYRSTIAELDALNDRELADSRHLPALDPRHRPRQRVQRLSDDAPWRRDAEFLPNSAGLVPAVFAPDDVSLPTLGRSQELLIWETVTPIWSTQVYGRRMPVM